MVDFEDAVWGCALRSWDFGPIHHRFAAKKSGFGIAEFIVKQLSPKTNKNDKQTEAEDNSDSSGFPVSFSSESKTKAITGVNPLSSNPIAASGLTSLERSLSELLNSSSKTDLLQWQNQDDEWQTAKLTLTNKDEINSKQDFIDQLQPLAEQAAKALGVDANLLLAQAALETGWGQAVLKNTQGVSSYNLFNIKADKAWQGNQTKTSTIEFDGGIAKKETASFRAYQSFQESFIDYVDFIKSNPRYSEALKKAANAYQYITALQQAGYATDPKYAEKIFSIYQAQIGNNAKSNHVSG